MAFAVAILPTSETTVLGEFGDADEPAAVPPLTSILLRLRILSDSITSSSLPEIRKGDCENAGEQWKDSVCGRRPIQRAEHIQ